MTSMIVYSLSSSRSLMAQHQAKVDEAIEQAKGLAKAMKTGKIATAEIMAANQMGSRLLGSRAVVDPKKNRGVCFLICDWGLE